ncbi:MAG TPA: hypothetical protein VG757_07405 [Devosia sp.]|nr:hypothetical protein [Devosia sp.]
MTITSYEGTLVRQYVDDTGRRRLNFIERKDGSFAYVEEFVETFIEGDDEYDEVVVWEVRQASGLFASLDDAEAEALTTAKWVTKRND